MSAVADARAALMVLAYAKAHGMPEPADVETTPTLRLGFDNLADLADWALLMEAVIGEHDSGPFRQHSARGEVLEAPVECWFIEVSALRSSRRFNPGSLRVVTS